MYRLAKQEDFADIIALCTKHKVLVPRANKRSILMVYENEQGRIIGLGALKVEAFIEPLIAENPLVGNGIFNRLEGLAIGSNYEEVNCICNPDKVPLFEKAGFEVIETKKVIMSKTLK